MPITPNVIRRIVSNEGHSNAPARSSAANITSPSAKESTSSAIAGRSGRCARRWRSTSTPIPARQSAARVTSWTCLDCARQREIRRHGQQVVRAARAQQRLRELEAHGHEVGGGHERSFPQPLQTAGGEGQVDVQEQHHRDQVEDEPDGVGKGRVRPLKAGQQDREARRHHQRAEAALRAAPPRDQPGEDEGEGDPDEEACAQAWLLEVVAGERERCCARGSHTSGHRQSQ